MIGQTISHYKITEKLEIMQLVAYSYFNLLTNRGLIP